MTRQGRRRKRLPKSERKIDRFVRQNTEVWGEMKYIRVPEEFKDAAGQEIRMVNPDTSIIRKWRKEEQKKEQVARKEAQARKETFDPRTIDSREAPMVDATLSIAVNYFANNHPWDRDEKGSPLTTATAEEIDNKILIVRAFDNPVDGFYEIADKPLEWLITELKEWGGAAFTGTSSGIMRELLSGENVKDGERPKNVTDISNGTPSEDSSN